MNEKTEKVLVGHLLRHKEHGYSVLYILRKSALRYLLLFAIVTTVIMVNRHYSTEGGAAYLLAGLAIGAVLRDAAWIRQGKRAWPLYEKVIDWAKVKEIAGTGQSEADNG
jgi:hypothetical protein